MSNHYVEYHSTTKPFVCQIFYFRVNSRRYVMKTILNHFSQTLNLIKAEDITETITSPQNPTNTKSGLQYTSKGLESRDDATRKSQPSKAGSASSQESPNPSPEPSTSNALKSGNRAKERVCFMLLNKNKMQDIHVNLHTFIYVEMNPIAIYLYFRSENCWKCWKYSWSQQSNKRQDLFLFQC